MKFGGKFGWVFGKFNLLYSLTRLLPMYLNALILRFSLFIFKAQAPYGVNLGFVEGRTIREEDFSLFCN